MHCLIVGMTGSGKSTLGKMFAGAAQDSGRPVLVLDSMMDEWKADFITDSPEEFLEAFWNERGAVCVIDEAADYAGRYDKAVIETALKGRHWGHKLIYIVQRSSLVSPSIRAQCSDIFLFNIDRDSSEDWAREFNQDVLCNAYNLPRGQYYHASRFGVNGRPYVSTGKVF